MDRDGYELFESLPDRSLSWRGYVRGLRGAQAKVWRLADELSGHTWPHETVDAGVALHRSSGNYRCRDYFLQSPHPSPYKAFPARCSSPTSRTIQAEP